jgi:Zn-dependent protease
MDLKFSKIEIRDLTKAWVAISFAFAIVLSSTLFDTAFFLNVVLSALTVGTGFLLHELGHKFVAQRYGCFAEFRSDNSMLMIALITSFFGIIFAAPGAVMIQGRVSKRRNGLISIAGPVVNIVLALFFMSLSFVFQAGFLAQVVSFGVTINLWLALFNMIPFFILDGKKVFAWNKSAWLGTVVLIIGLMFVKSLLPLVALF